MRGELALQRAAIPLQYDNTDKLRRKYYAHQTTVAKMQL